MIALPHRRAFWFGIAAVSAGVVLHLPMYIGAADMGYRLAGMPMNPSMKVGMALIVVGIALSAYGVVPRGAGVYPDRVAGVRVAALDEAPIQRAHLALLAVMAVAVTIDVMKPTTLAFVVPGVAQEYGLKSPLNPQGQVPVALLPLCALVGMVLGSIGWGWLGDRIGRRASILLAGVMFIATSVCGAMPAFGWRVAGVQLCALFPLNLVATWTVAASRTQPLSGPCYATACWPARHPGASLLGLLTVPVRYQKGRQRNADRPDRPRQEHRRPG
jgi:putative MFS transporter